jgi:hypothetical protein
LANGLGDTVDGSFSCLCDFFDFFSSGWFVEMEKHFAASNPAFDFLALDFKDCPNTTELTVLQ